MVEDEFVAKLNESRCDGGQDPTREISLQSAKQKPLDPRRSQNDVTLKIDTHEFVITQ